MDHRPWTIECILFFGAANMFDGPNIKSEAIMCGVRRIGKLAVSGERNPSEEQGGWGALGPSKMKFAFFRSKTCEVGVISMS